MVCGDRLVSVESWSFVQALEKGGKLILTSGETHLAQYIQGMAINTSLKLFVCFYFLMWLLALYFCWKALYRQEDNFSPKQPRVPVELGRAFKVKKKKKKSLKNLLVDVCVTYHPPTHYLLLGRPKSLLYFFCNLKDPFFIFTNTFIDLDILSMSAISHYWLLVSRGQGCC